MKKWIKRLAFTALALFMVLWSVFTVGGLYFTVRPRTSDFADLETLGGHAVEPVTIAAEDGVNLSAWYVPASSDRAVILLAGIDANRNSCRSRGEFFLEQGFSVLLPDLRASGKSGGKVVTIGWQERKDLVACYNFLTEKGYAHIGADGVSLGAATICYAIPELPGLSFAILESSYDTLISAVRNRLAMFSTPHFIAYPFYVGFSIIARATPWAMQPVDYMKYSTAPTLIMAGDSEKEIPVHETQSLFDNCTAPLKRLHFFKGSGHWDFLGRYTEEYREQVLAFLAEVFKPQLQAS